MDVSLGSALHARSRLQEVCSPDRDDSVPARPPPGDARRRRRATTIRSPDRVRFGMVVDASAATRRGACMVDPLLAGDRAAAPRTLVDVLADVTARHPDAPALDDTVTVLTYAELTEQARRMAAELVAAGVCRGDRVGVRAPSGTTDLYVSVLGILHAGAAYVPVDVDDPPERADLVFSEARVTAVVGARRQITVPADVRGSRRATARPPRGVLPEVGTGDDAWVIFTSGSTGVPKGVAVSHRSAAAFVDAEARMFLQDSP